MTADTVREKAQDQEKRAALCLYAQLLSGITLYACFRGSGALWLSVLLTGPFLVLLRLLRKGAPGNPSRLLALPFLVDSLAAYALLCGLIRLLLTDLPAWAAAGIVTAFFLLCAGKEDRALTIMSRPAAWLIALPLFCCALGCLPQGSLGRLFPLLGKGPAAAGMGGIWLAGCLSPAAAPAETEKPGLLPALTAWLLAIATAALLAFLQPPFSPNPPASWAACLSLPSRLSLPAALWAPTMAALILLLFYAHASALHTAGMILSPGNPKNRRFLLIAAALLMLPAGALREETFEQALLWALPFRLIVTLAALILERMKKYAPSKEGKNA